MSSIKLPEPKELVDGLNALLGLNLKIVAGPANGKIFAPPPVSFVSAWKDDAGVVVGGIVFDLTAAFYLSGTILMMPAAVIKADLKAGKPTPMILDAISEISNVLSGLVNRVKGNPHVISYKVNAFASMTPEEKGWAKTPKELIQLSMTGDVGVWKLFAFAK